MIPFVAVLFFSAIAGKLSEYFDKKNILMLGLLIYGATGIMPAFATSIDQKMILRLIAGIGVGLVLPMTNAIIADHYLGNERRGLVWQH